MGIDFWPCKRCGDTFPDCGDYEQCECGNVWCSDDRDCARLDGLIRPDDDGESSCSYCRKEKAEPSDILTFLFKKYKLKPEEVEQEYLKSIR